MKVIPFIEFSLYEMFHIFIFWAFIGWCIEVCWMTLETGKYQNRGFLNMPICPIYGFGVIMVTVFFRPLSDTVFALFLASSLLCTGFELLVGIGMEKMFNTRWWDYSHERYNYKGYICLKISILWGLGCVIVVRLVQPMVETLVDKIPIKIGLALIIIWSVLIVIDFISSICAVNKMNNRLKQIDEISKIMLLGSQMLGGKLSHGTLDTKEKYDKLAEIADEKSTELKEKYIKIVDSSSFNISEWKEKYDKLMNARDRSVERFLKAFPGIRSMSYSESMEKLKRRIGTLSNKAKIIHRSEDEIPQFKENEDNDSHIAPKM